MPQMKDITPLGVFRHYSLTHTYTHSHPCEKRDTDTGYGFTPTPACCGCCAMQNTVYRVQSRPQIQGFDTELGHFMQSDTIRTVS